MGVNLYLLEMKVCMSFECLDKDLSTAIDLVVTRTHVNCDVIHCVPRLSALPENRDYFYASLELRLITCCKITQLQQYGADLKIENFLFVRGNYPVQGC